MTTEFFNFGSDETYHFFKWMCDRFDLKGRIADAFTRAEKLKRDESSDEDIWLKRDSSSDEDICIIARNILADKLLEILYEAAPDLDPSFDPSELEIGTIWHDAQAMPSADSLLRPIYALALSRIDCAKVAEALLIGAGMWAPSKEPTKFH